MKDKNYSVINSPLRKMKTMAYISSKEINPFDIEV